MFYVYAVIVGLDGQKTRWLAGSTEDEFMSKHMANVETCGMATYAYVKDSRGGTVFFIRRPEYESQPLGRQPQAPTQPVAMDQRRRKCRQS